MFALLVFILNNIYFFKSKKTGRTLSMKCFYTKPYIVFRKGNSRSNKGMLIYVQDANWEQFIFFSLYYYSSTTSYLF